MEQDKIINLQKILYPEEYKTGYIFVYPTFNNELKELIGKSGYVNNFKMKYYKGLKFLEQLKKLCINQSKLFECLTNADGIYSMILKGEKNIRILFDFQVYDRRNIVILYNCFEEKRTKDYFTQIENAKSRRKEIFSI